MINTNNTETNIRKIDAPTIVRFVLYAIGLVNIILELGGRSIIPVNEAAVTETISVVYLAVVWFWGYWKNNDITKKARSRTY